MLKRIIIVLITFILIILILVINKKFVPEKFEDPIIGSYFVQVENNVLGVEDIRDTMYINLGEDEQGRVMYLFRGVSLVAWKKLYNSDYLFAVLIQQATDDDYVYYYPDVNFIIKQMPAADTWYNDDVSFLEEMYKTIPLYEIEELKEKNDWGKPFQELKCEKKLILYMGFRTREKNVSKKVRQTMFKQEFSDVYPKYETFLNYLTGDNYDRHIYFCRTVDGDKNYANSYIVMFFPDNTYVIQEIFDIWNYQEELRNFKSNYNWNKSIQKE